MEFRNNQNDFFNFLEISENIIEDEREMKCTKQQGLLIKNSMNQRNVMYIPKRGLPY